MPEHLRALVVILVIAAAVFHVARPVAVQVVPAETFARWRTAWFGLTLALFLSHSFWIYALLLVFWGRYMASRESNMVGLFFVLLFVAPPSLVTIPGFGVINQLFPVNQYRLLSLTLLLPLAWRLRQRASTLPLGRTAVDRMVLGYLTVICLLAFRDASITGGMRQVFVYFMDILLPYYVVSRTLRSLDDFRGALYGFAVGATLLSVLALIEVARYWKLYQAVLVALGLNPWEFGGYLERAGVLRPNVTLGNSIVLGYVIMVGVGCYLYLMDSMGRGWRRYMGLAVLVGGVIWSLSRGPWVGLALLLLVFVLTGHKVLGRLFKAAVLGGVALLVALQLPVGRFLVDLLPFMGESEAGSVEYRADLLTQALPVVQRNLWFGSTDYLYAPELQIMYSGGIIDIVNTYLAVVLDHGVVGLFFFAGAFVFALVGVLRAMRRCRTGQPESWLLGRVLLAIVLAIMVVIYTVSSIVAVAIVYWIALGICVAYIQMVNTLPTGHEQKGSPV